MIEFGKTLKAAREAKGLTVEQVADSTRIMTSMIENLEAEDFSRIAAPLYGRGFVKLYCGAVGLDPEPLVAEFMEIYNGNRDLGIKERVTAAAPIPEPPPRTAPSFDDGIQNEDAPVEPSMPLGGDGIRLADMEEPPPAAPMEFLSHPSENRQPDLFSEPEEPPPPPQQEARTPENPMANFSRYAPPVRQQEYEEARPPVARWLILAAGAIVVLAVLFFGLRALYRATSAPRTDDETPPAAEAVPAPTAAKPAAEKPAAAARPATQPDTTRVPQKIPSLYVD
jgi:cytoskeletal protein RodZ